MDKDQASAIFFASTLIGEGYHAYRKEYFSSHPQCQKIDDRALRFSFLVVSAAVAIIAINLVLPSSRRKSVISLFFEEVERRFAAFTTPINKVGFSFDEIAKSKNEAILLAQAIPEASALALVDVPFLFGLMMKFRTRLYINAYLNSNDQPLLGGRMADVAFLYVEHLLGDDAFSSPTSPNDGINRILRMQLTTIFNTDLQTICENTPAALRGQ